ncbi:uncharacterized protein TNIN_376701 [Trichonephila inaurata madagascariensis]|uniref:VWFA domain-containing protein n=1 Tax=Trichonephila inaurata madagascariensis TaxID=2747483 RepID=A0A8X6YAP4_9ARAC|nr:uncharacterized protein TNIN_376701 [Trichonephila inaurata madagascariensis]
MVMAKKLDAEAVKNGLELIILIDRSSSIDPKDFKLGINFIKFLLAEFGVRNGNNTSGTRAAVLTFGNAVDVVFNLDNGTIIGPQAASRALDTIQVISVLGIKEKNVIMKIFKYEEKYTAQNN